MGRVKLWADEIDLSDGEWHALMRAVRPVA